MSKLSGVRVTIYRSRAFKGSPPGYEARSFEPFILYHTRKDTLITLPPLSLADPKNCGFLLKTSVGEMGVLPFSFQEGHNNLLALTIESSDTQSSSPTEGK